MLIVIQCSNETLVHAERTSDPIPLVALAATASIDCIVEVRVGDVDFIRIDAKNRAWSL